MKFQPRLNTVYAVLALAVFSPAARALVQLEDGRDRVYVNASVTMGYDSNVFTNAQKQGSFSYLGDLGLEFSRRAGWIGVNGTVSVDYARYADFRSQDYTDPKFSLELSKQTGRTTGSLTFSGQKIDRADVDVNTRDTSWNYDLGLNLQYPVIDRYTISASLDYDRIVYEDSALFTNLTAYTGNLYLYYVLNEQRDLFINGRSRLDDEANGSYDIDNAISGGVSGRVYGPFNGSLEIGYGDRIPYHTVDHGQFTDFTANGSATWNIDRRNQLTITVGRDFSNTATANSVDATTGSILFQESIGASSSATIELKGGENKFLGVEGLIPNDNGKRRVDWFYSINASYYYAVNEHLKISLNYTYYRSYSTLAYAVFPREEYSLTLASHW